MTAIQLTLPYPPSANRYWRNYKGVTVISQEAREYKRLVKLTAKARGVANPTDKEVRLYADVYRPRMSGDLDNRLKILADALKGVAFEDDKQIVEIHMRRFDDKANPRVEVAVEIVMGVAANVDE